MNKWISDSVFYQIYPTSFYDSDGDGLGDINGITQKLDYVKSLGVNGIWLNPFYPSPFMDGGYDVSDYYDVNPRLGSIADFEKLLKRSKELGIRVVIDLVIGHTSFNHEWFKESAKGEKNKYSDWYIWTDSIFNKYKDKTIHGLYPRDGGYYINYYACQPALNYGFNRVENPGKRESEYDLGTDWMMHYSDERLKPLREEILNIMRFWLKKGVDGFRVDLANSLVKGCVYDSDKDEEIEGLKWLWNILIGTIRKEYPDVGFIAEWVYPSNSVGKCGFDVDYLGHDRPEYNDLFRNEKDTNIIPNFEKGHNYFSPDGLGSVDKFLKYTQRLYREVEGKGYFSVPSGYHDVIRQGEKKSEDELKVIFAFLLTFKHVPFIYYGDEIGMTHYYGINKDGGYIRTGCRTPMQWNGGKNCGFSTADENELYLPVKGDKGRNVEDMEKDENSLLNLVKRLIALRLGNNALSADGELTILESENGGYPLVYERRGQRKSFVVVIYPKKGEHKVKKYGKVIEGANFKETSDGVKLMGESFVIFEK